MHYQLIRFSCILTLIILSQAGQGYSQGNNPSGMGIIDPRQPRQEFENKSSRTTDALREAGLVVAPSETEPDRQATGKKGMDSWPNAGQSLFLAAGGGTLEEIVILLRSGADVNHVDSAGGMTPLMTVRQESQAAALLAAGANLNITDRKGNTALHHALFAEEADKLVPLLLACGAEVDMTASGNNNETPLLSARQLFFEGRDPDLAERIIRILAYAGADLNAKDALGYTVLITAAVNNKPGLARLMIDLGANPDTRTPDGMTALAWARQLGNKDVEQVLIQAGATD